MLTVVRVQLMASGVLRRGAGISDAPAALAEVPTNLALDWFYLAPHVIQYAWSPLALWSIVGVATTVLVLLPYLSRAAREPRRAAAVVELANCNGCRRCFVDCPYNAVEMVTRTDGRPHPFQASVRADLCAGCGICAGACPSSTPDTCGALCVDLQTDQGHCGTCGHACGLGTCSAGASPRPTSRECGSPEVGTGGRPTSRR